MKFILKSSTRSKIAKMATTSLGIPQSQYDVGALKVFAIMSSGFIIETANALKQCVSNMTENYHIVTPTL